MALALVQELTSLLTAVMSVLVLSAQPASPKQNGALTDHQLIVRYKQVCLTLGLNPYQDRWVKAYGKPRIEKAKVVWGRQLTAIEGPWVLPPIPWTVFGTG
jgi:hypothetical protein